MNKSFTDELIEELTNTDDTVVRITHPGLKTKPYSSWEEYKISKDYGIIKSNYSTKSFNHNTIKAVIEALDAIQKIIDEEEEAKRKEQRRQEILASIDLSPLCPSTQTIVMQDMGYYLYPTKDTNTSLFSAIEEYTDTEEMYRIKHIIDDEWFSFDEWLTDW